MKGMLSAAYDLFRKGRNIGTGLGSAPSGYGPEYDQLFEVNPYRDLTYHESGWQRFLNYFGFRTDADRWREDAQVNSNEYDASVMSMIQQNQYNSPIEQAARMREAGLNPDLLGIGDVSEAASPAEDPNGMSQNATSDNFASFGQAVVSVLSQSMAIYKDFKSLGLIQNQIDAGNIANAQAFLEGVNSLIQGQITSDDLVSQTAFSDKLNALHTSIAEDEALPWEQSLPYLRGYGKKQRKQFYSIYRQGIDSLINDKNAWQNYVDRGSAIIGANQNRASGFYSDSEGVDASLNVVTENLAELDRENRVLKAQNDKYSEELRSGALQNQGIQQDIQGQYLETLSDGNAGFKQATSDLATWDENWYAKQLDIAIDKAKKNIVEGLERESSNGNHFAKVLLMSWTLNNILTGSANINGSVGLSLGANFGLQSLIK